MTASIIGLRPSKSSSIDNEITTGRPIMASHQLTCYGTNILIASWGLF